MPPGASIGVGLLVAGTAFYLAVIAWLWAGIGRSRQRAERSAATPAVSVVVAARDEAGRIGACLLALQRQDYAGPLEIVVVDDRSRDGTADRVERILAAWRGATRLKLVRAPDPPRFACPKKSALAAGIEVAAGRILLFTDADCEPPRAWVRALVARFTDDVGLVAGFAFPEPLPRLRLRLLAIDNLAVAALAEGSIGMGAPLSCTGRSLAWRREVYDEVGGFASIGHLVSGDDVYFLRLVASRTQWEIAYCPAPEAAVPSAAGPVAWRALLDRKVRHASKAAHYEGGAFWLGAAAYAYHAVLLAGLLDLFALQIADPAFLTAWLTRWAADLALLWRFAPRGGRDRALLAFLPLVEVLYIPYVLFLVPLGRAGCFRWKDRGPAPSASPDS